MTLANSDTTGDSVCPLLSTFCESGKFYSFWMAIDQLWPDGFNSVSLWNRSNSYNWCGHINLIHFFEQTLPLNGHFIRNKYFVLPLNGPFRWNTYLRGAHCCYTIFTTCNPIHWLLLAVDIIWVEDSSDFFSHISVSLLGWEWSLIPKYPAYSSSVVRNGPLMKGQRRWNKPSSDGPQTLAEHQQGGDPRSGLLL